MGHRDVRIETRNLSSAHRRTFVLSTEAFLAIFLHLIALLVQL